MEGTSVNDSQLRHVGRLTGLQWLVLEQTRITDDGIRHLANFKQLRGISLDGFRVVREGFGVGDEGLAVLAQLPKLEMLDVVRTNVTDAGIAHLRGHQSLKSFSVTGITVTDRSLELISTLSSLEWLRLGLYDEGANISNDGLKHLTKLKKLKSLDLSATQVNNDGLVHLRGLDNLEYLSLDNSNVTGDGLANLEPLAGSLKTIRIYGTTITDDHARHLSKLTSLERITALLEFTDEGVKALSTLTNLKSLDLPDRVTDAAIPHIIKMKSLESLEFQGCPITDAAVAPLAKLPKLEYLMITQSQITSRALDHLKGFPALIHLHIDFGRSEGRPEREKLSLSPIADLVGLKSLDISGEGLENEELVHLRPLQELEDLEMGYRFVVSDYGMRHVASLPSLRSLRIEESTITDTGLAFLEGTDNLEYVTLMCLATDEGLKHLQRLPSLRYFQIASPHVTEAGLVALKESLPSLQRVNTYSYRRGEIMATLSTKDLLLREGKPETRVLTDALEGRLPPPLVVDNWLNTGGKPITFENLQGKVVMLDFWGVWCGPCLEAMPRLKALYEKYKDDGFEIVGVHTTNGAEEMAAYVEAERLPWPVAADVGDQTVQAFHVNTYPDVYFIDRAGVLRMADLQESEIEKAIEMLLAEGDDGGQRNADADVRR